MHKIQDSKGSWVGGWWEVGGLAGQGRMGVSQSLLTAKAHSAVVQSPG